MHRFTLEGEGISRTLEEWQFWGVVMHEVRNTVCIGRG